LIQDQFADDDFIQSRRKHAAGDNAHFSWIWALRGSIREWEVVQDVAGGHKYLFGQFGRNERISTPSRLMAGKNLSASNWSSVMNELASESAPRR